MSRNWIRALQLSVQGSKGTFDLSAMRVRFDIKNLTTQTPHVAAIRITNLSDATAQALPGRDAGKLTLSAGYEDNLGEIFKGEIKQKRIGRENPTDTFVDLFATNHDRAYNHAVVSKTLKAGSTGRDVYNACLDAMKPFGVKEGQVAEGLEKIKYRRPVMLFGMARDHLRSLAYSAGCTWNMRGDDLDVIEKDGARKGSAIVLNSLTGLVGMPVQTEQGITARCLINPRIGVNSLVQIDQKSIQQAVLNLSIPQGEGALGTEPKLPSLATDGIYRVVAMDLIGDTHGQPWYDELYCIARGALPTSAQASLGWN